MVDVGPSLPYFTNMKYNKNFYNYIKPTLEKLQEIIGDEFVVFGSAPLYLLEVVEFSGSINDLDISIKNEQNIPGDAERVTFQKDQDKYFYKIKINDFQIDLAPAWKGHEKQFETIFKNPVVVDGFKFANLDVVENWKKEMVKKYHRQKDADYLEKIQEYRRR